MKQFFITSIFITLLSFTAQASEVDLPGNIGRISITNRVVTVINNDHIPDGEYKVMVDGKEIIVEFSNGKGSIK